MPDLKTRLLEFVRSGHRGKARAITIARLVYEFIDSEYGPLDERTIRKIIRQLNFEGYPILSTTRCPYGVYFATSREEVDEYLANLGSRMKATIERMRAVDRTWTKDFVQKQLELFS